MVAKTASKPRATAHRRRTSKPRPKQAAAASAASKPGTEEHAEERAGPRPLWSGTISFGLVTVQVNMFPAVRPADTAMRLLSPDGMPLQRRYECPVEHRDIPWTELVRGYQIDEDHYVVLADDELEAIAPRKSRDIDLRLFAPAKSLDPFLFERPYVLTPGGDSTKPYRLLADAMEREDKAGIATFVMRTKEYLVAILARKGILWAETLRFAGELRSPKDVGLPANKKVAAKDRVAAFSSAIRSLAKSDIDRDELIDRRQSQLQTLVENKVRRGEGVVEVSGKQADAAAAPSADKPEEADLFAQIRRSLRMVGRANASNHAGGRRKGA